MVSKFIAMGMLVGVAFADKLTLDQKYAEETFETAICKDKFEGHNGFDKELKLDDLVKTHGCCDKKKHICVIHEKSGKFGLTCSEKNHEEFKAYEGFEIKEKLSLFGNEYKEVEKIECKEAELTYPHKYEAAVLAMGTTKDQLKDLAKVDGDHTNCLLVKEVEKKEDKKGEDKKDDKKEDKKEYKISFFTVKGNKEYKPAEKLEEITILGTKYTGLFCANDETLEKEAQKFAKTEESSCCRWYVWLIVGIVVVAGGVGTWYALKEDDVEEDEFANEYA